jgi:hypothetical protein
MTVSNNNTNPVVIPKIIHQLWIGDKPAPNNLMNTWKEKNPEFEYIYWNEEEFKKRNIKFKCQDKIDEIEEICGKVDIMRWELLYKYGGIFIDADSICIESIDEIEKLGYVINLTLQDSDATDFVVGNTITQALPSGVIVTGEIVDYNDSDNVVSIVYSGFHPSSSISLVESPS